ncbi:hypothetical protein [Micromonospora sp. NPDC023644]|uniref:hypothetical protein n=1 Tax=Micromonospora sp. NPDC023644 TaxID=3154321 RepID=UPI0033DA6560
MARQKRNGDRHSSNGDGKTDVMVRDDITAELFAFPHSDFFRATGTGTEPELAGNRAAPPAPPRAVATGRHEHPVVS